MKFINLIYALVFFTIAIFALKYFSVSDESIIIALIGALATFVVVGNYVQVKDMERKFNERVEEQRKSIDKINSELNELSKLKFNSNEIRREILMAQIRPYYVKFNAYLKFINFMDGFMEWNNKEVIKKFDSAFLGHNDKNMDELIKTYPYLKVYKFFKELITWYEHGERNDFVNILPSKYASECEDYSLGIFNSYHNGVIDKIQKSSFNNINKYIEKEIQKELRMIDDTYNIKEIDFSLIADVSLFVSENVLNHIVDLTRQYEAIRDY